MRDDLNTPEAIAALFDAARRAGQEVSARPSARPNSAREFAGLGEAFEEFLSGILGFDLSKGQTIYVDAGVPGEEAFGTPRVEVSTEADDVRIRYVGEPLDPEAQKKVARREKARREKDWALADRLRDELRAEGWIVEDTPEGPVLSRR
jgi:cysteinyl-tRNA synthetase